eukprot:m.20916 g.20916  ORF g.20916 m.20916 type:complete len:393 (-) comp7952_c0_seq1:241-1419(-)
MALYAPLEPYMTGMLPVSPVHTIYYEQSGNPDGYPIVFVHGGPGGGTSGDDRRFFDPKFYRIVVFDQRGAGKSTPSASLEDNTTWHLVSDMERLRTVLGIEQWAVFGGSWGSTLALSYAESYPERVTGLVLRGIFMLRREELLWFYQEGASFLFPDYWEDYIAPIPESERGDMMGAYYRRLTGPNEAERLACAKAWSTWEMATCKLFVDPAVIARATNPAFALAFARIECHYFVNAGFFPRDGELLKNVDRIRHIPCTIVQGRYDVVCPMKSAWDLHRAWPESNLVVVNDAGHSAKEVGITAGLVEACNRLRDQLTQAQLSQLSLAAAAAPSTPSRRPVKEEVPRLDPAAQPVAGVKTQFANSPSLRFHGPEGQSVHIKRVQPPGGKSSIFG